MQITLCFINLTPAELKVKVVESPLLIRAVEQAAVKELQFFPKRHTQMEPFVLSFSMVTTFQSKEGCALCHLDPEETLCQAADSTGATNISLHAASYWHPFVIILACLNRKSTYSTALFAVKDHTKKSSQNKTSRRKTAFIWMCMNWNWSKC